ncbi:cation diffusion facilitator family transporter [Parabacteroides sp. AD58]|uniref:Cation diffusion facilitator family transporter n=1 Tax=Parabacteroides absconsus TaxID=2951805 RepID=A0ABZ2INF9_9BACT|nr:cation diffusion facilitator family transporter [Parabacteroides sp. AD58]MCM6901429.1 cation diffusion facilitator family transporter [Parabacteroides sp. AD58]
MANHHEHSHHHEHHLVPASLNKIFIFCIALNLLFVIIEAGVGFIYNSLGLLSDAGHNLSDVFSLLLALVAFRMAKLHATHHFTYGYKKATILISLANAMILLVAVGAILIESIYKLKNPEPVSGEAISWTAGIGILINGLTTWLLMRDRKKDLNVQGAFLHMMMDTLVSVGVVISGILISFTGWNWIDSIISLLIAAVILISTFGLLKESLFLSMDAVPASVHLETIQQEIEALPQVKSWHHLHIWGISTTENAATVHIVLNNIAEMETVKPRIKQIFSSAGISHSTIEFESASCQCHEQECS